ATLTKWYEEHGRHEIFAGNKKVQMADTSHKLKLNAEDVARGKQHDLDEVGIAKNAREEKLRARDEKLKEAAKNAQMEKPYREHILKQPKPEGGFVPLDALGGIKPAAPKADTEVGSVGD
ncbi:MAG: radical SAM protein, partial [bacterium]